MVCDRCGAELKNGDKFCCQCGAPVRIREGFYEAIDEPEELYYDDKLYRDDRRLYRDTFLEKKEEKSHALLVTVTVLLVIAVLTVTSLLLFFFLKKESGPENAENGGAMVSGEDQLLWAEDSGKGDVSAEPGGEIVILDNGGQEDDPNRIQNGADALLQ